ncbi:MULTISPECIES: hypothetical protein [Haloarcula]|uniref:hypothetical protein n=1 Tax=Haloarcula TaxID=2237 RepID=UPI0023E8160B|nr:hypothetical protein [Halomicroarcula sp. SHR3]
MSEDTDDILRDIRRWLKIIGIQEAKPILTEALSSEDPEEERDLRITYHLTDGEHGTRDIAELISYSRYWIMSRYEEWSNMGVIERNAPNSPYHHVISLEEVGIEVPDIPEPEDDDSEGEAVERQEDDDSEEEAVERQEDDDSGEEAVEKQEEDVKGASLTDYQ